MVIYFRNNYLPIVARNMCAFSTSHFSYDCTRISFSTSNWNALVNQYEQLIHSAIDILIFTLILNQNLGFPSFLCLNILYSSSLNLLSKKLKQHILELLN